MKKVLFCLLAVFALVGCKGGDEPKPSTEDGYLFSNIQYTVESTAILNEVAKLNINYFASGDTTLMTAPKDVTTKLVTGGTTFNSPVLKSTNYTAGLKLDVAVDTTAIPSDPLALAVFLGRLTNKNNGLYVRVVMTVTDCYADGTNYSNEIFTKVIDFRGMTIDLSNVSEFVENLENLQKSNSYVCRGINGKVTAVGDFTW